jgi:putative colanic acid biosynthesis acetyltransferase WcaF
MRLDLYDNSFFSRGTGRLTEALWILCKTVFFLNPLPWPSRLRVFLLRRFGATIGHHVVIHSGVNITFPWRFTTGDHVWIGEDVTVLSLAQVTLGSHVCLSQRAFLCTGSHDHRKETFDLLISPIVVENECWIAAQAFVGKGVRVGQGSTVGVSAVILKNVPPNSFACGNPCTITAAPANRT